MEEKGKFLFRKRIMGFCMALLLACSLHMSGMLSSVNAETATNSQTHTSGRVEQIIENMTIKQKITQMFMMDFRQWKTKDSSSANPEDMTKMNAEVRKIVEDYDFGAVIYFANNILETDTTLELTLEFQKAAMKDDGIPLLISADQEGGKVYRLGSGTALPGNMALGATGNKEYAFQAGCVIGSELSSVGINTNLAPVVDVNNNANNPVIGLRSYGDDAQMVGIMASETVKGMAEYNVIGCAKHFPGHGDTETDSHYGLPMVDKSFDVLEKDELKPYEVVIDQGIEMIMIAHILYPQLESDKMISNKSGQEESLPATMSDDIITGLLKNKMGFNGIVCTDAMHMNAIAEKWDETQAVINAINAGADLICMPTSMTQETDLEALNEIIAGVESAIESGVIKEERLDDACRRILTVKEKHGILDLDLSSYSVEKANAVVGSVDNRNTEREIAASAVTVVQNKNNILPLKLNENEKVLMLSPYANETGQMIMGWNRAEEAGLIPETAEVEVINYNQNNLEECKQKIDNANVVIINSEISNASRVNNNHWLYVIPQDLSQYVVEKQKKIIIMSVDNPYDVQLYADADAVLAVYGCKGSSVDPTEALIGHATSSVKAFGPNIPAGIEVIMGVHGAQGTLPVDIPKLAFNPSTNLYEYSSEIVFPRGYGILYDARKTENGPNEDPKEDPKVDPEQEEESEKPYTTPEMKGDIGSTTNKIISPKTSDDQFTTVYVIICLIGGAVVTSSIKRVKE